MQRIADEAITSCILSTAKFIVTVGRFLQNEFVHSETKNGKNFHLIEEIP